MLFCGIDLHSNNCFIVIFDEDDKVLYSKRHTNNLEEICALLSPYLLQLFGVVVESTFNWYWLVDGLQAAGHSVHLANTTAIKQYDGLKHRGDESDARHLAHVLRLGILPEGHIMPKADRGVRDLARKRMQLVQMRNHTNSFNRNANGSTTRLPLEEQRHQKTVLRWGRSIALWRDGKHGIKSEFVGHPKYRIANRLDRKRASKTLSRSSRFYSPKKH